MCIPTRHGVAPVRRLLQLAVLRGDVVRGLALQHSRRRPPTPPSAPTPLPRRRQRRRRADVQSEAAGSTTRTELRRRAGISASAARHVLPATDPTCVDRRRRRRQLSRRRSRGRCDDARLDQPLAAAGCRARPGDRRTGRAAAAAAATSAQLSPTVVAMSTTTPTTTTTTTAEHSATDFDECGRRSSIQLTVDVRIVPSSHAHRPTRRATKQFCRVESGGVNWVHV